jgi:hypothetical protein
LSDGLPDSNAGVGFFVTTFDLDVPAGTDVPISFVFDNSTQPFRALLFVNGWKYGKVCFLKPLVLPSPLIDRRIIQRVGNLGPQVKFPVHQGLLDYSGTKYAVTFSNRASINIRRLTIAVRSLWRSGLWRPTPQFHLLFPSWLTISSREGLAPLQRIIRHGRPEIWHDRREYDVTITSRNFLNRSLGSKCFLF